VCCVSCSSLQPHRDCELVLGFLQQVGHWILQQGPEVAWFSWAYTFWHAHGCAVALLIPLPGMHDQNLAGVCAATSLYHLTRWKKFAVASNSGWLCHCTYVGRAYHEACLGLALTLCCSRAALLGPMPASPARFSITSRWFCPVRRSLTTSGKLPAAARTSFAQHSSLHACYTVPTMQTL
jgi:hypothetical protein